MSNFSLKLGRGEKVQGQFHCTVSARAHASAAARDRGLLIVTDRRFLVFAESRLCLAVVSQTPADDGTITDRRVNHDVVQFEAQAGDLLLVKGNDVYREDGSVEVSVAMTGGVADLFLRCLNDVDNIKLLGLLTDLRLSVAR